MAGILDSLPHTRLATVLPGRARQLHANQALLWKPLSEPRVPLKVGWYSAMPSASRRRWSCCGLCWRTWSPPRDAGSERKPRRSEVFADLYP